MSPFTPVEGTDPPPSIVNVMARVFAAVFRVVATPPEVVTSPVRSVLLMEVDPVNFDRFPFAGEPVVVTVPDPPPTTVTHAAPFHH
jgi:hypothetical protein